MFASRLGPRTISQTLATRLDRYPAAWPAELPPPTSATSCPAHSRPSKGDAQKCGHHLGAFADGGGNALDRSRSHVADREYAGQAGLERAAYRSTSGCTTPGGLLLA